MAGVGAQVGANVHDLLRSRWHLESSLAREHFQCSTQHFQLDHFGINISWKSVPSRLTIEQQMIPKPTLILITMTTEFY